MKVSSKTHYALLTVLDLALHRNTGVVKVPDISRRQGIPQKFLEQILLALRNGGVVSSKRGAKGGYYLSRPAAEISLADVVRLTEETLLKMKEREPSVGMTAAFQDVWDTINEFVVDKLEGVSLQDICERAEVLSSVPEYSI